MENSVPSLAHAIRSRSQRSVLIGLAAESASNVHMWFEPHRVPYLRHFPWANAQVARLVLSNGTDFNRPEATWNDIIRFKNLYHGLDPASEPGDIWSLMNRRLYEQLPLQHPQMSELARSWILYGESLEGCELFDWESVLGHTLIARVRSTIFLHVWAAQNRGVIDRSLLYRPHMQRAITASGGREIIEAVLDDLTLTPDGFKERFFANQSKNAVPALGDFNPILRYPLVDLGNGIFVAPSVPHILQTASTDALYYRGADAWNGAFTRALGDRIEKVTEIDLRMLEGGTVIPEITYGKKGKRSVEWIVVFDECVLLIECKSARVGVDALGTIEGERRLIERYIERAAGQIDRTALEIATGTEEFASVPRDRPIFGLVVTAEDIPLANTPIDRYQFKSDTPVEVLSLRELSAFSTAVVPSSGAYIADFFATRDPLDPSFVRRLVTDYPHVRHPVHDEAWALYRLLDEEIPPQSAQPT